MKVEIKVPKMGESVVQARIGQILKPIGSVVKQDEEILELETEKVNQVIYAPSSGKLELSVSISDTVNVDQVIGFIDTSVEAPKEQSTKVKPQEPSKKEEIKPVKESIETIQTFPKARISIDEALQNQKEEVSTPVVTQSRPQEPKQEILDQKQSRKKMSGLRRVIADRLVQVKNETAMLTTFNEVDMSAVMQTREKEQESFQKKHGVKLGFMSFFVKACVAALQEFPAINARIDGSDIVYNHFYDIGIAVGTEKGLFVPVLRNCDQLSFAEIEKQLKSFAEKAKNSTITLADMQGGTFTITNGGVYGSMLSTPILNPPQSGILGMHNIVKRAVVVNDEIVIRPIMYLALSYDHRIVDGKESISFLMHIKKNLEEPTRLLLDL
jgi:2-oxoglutarate dehydrogenase E2 component (dihydrolipoamide succinyltransferase)